MFSSLQELWLGVEDTPAQNPQLLSILRTLSGESGHRHQAQTKAFQPSECGADLRVFPSVGTTVFDFSDARKRVGPPFVLIVEIKIHQRLSLI